MAYDKHTWTCDEPITVERLNHIEDGIAAGGDCDCGFECEETVTLLTEETVTTTMGEGDSAEGTLQSVIDFSAYDSVIVTFNGVEYTCPVVLWDGDYGCGSVDGTFTDYPFSMGTFSIDPVSGDQTVLFTQTAGTYSIKVESVSIDVTTSTCFCAAVNKCVQGNGKLIEAIGGGTCPDSQTTYNEYNITWDEILQGIHDGVTFWLVDTALGNYYQIITFTLEENVSDYRVRAYHYDEQSVTQLILYSDTTDGRLRDVRCTIN